jgi:hypothetical protein
MFDTPQAESLSPRRMKQFYEESPQKRTKVAGGLSFASFSLDVKKMKVEVACLFPS